MTPSKRRRPHRDPVTPSEHFLTEAEIEELGLEEAPLGAGPSWEELEERRRRDGEH